jgi:ribosomal protein S18 acetylase RimI-like enzyme
MSSAQPKFKTRERKEIYNFIDDHGGATYDDLFGSGILTETDRYHQIVAVMKRDGMIEEEDGVLRTAVDAGVEEKHDVDGMTVTVRRARQEDISGVIGVMRQVTSEKRYVVAESVEQQLSGDSTLMDTDLENQHFFVATVDDEVIGWCGLDIPEMDKLSHTAELTLGVLEEYRGKGIGDHLLERGLEWAEEKSLHKVYNSIPSVNESAIEFLKEHGWKKEAIRSDHYRIDGEFVDEVMMEKSFFG